MTTTASTSFGGWSPGTAFATFAGASDNSGVIDVGLVDAAPGPMVAEDLDHCCSEEGRKYRAKYQLLLIEHRRITDFAAMDHLDNLIAKAGANFARERVEAITLGECPF